MAEFHRLLAAAGALSVPIGRSIETALGAGVRAQPCVRAVLVGRLRGFPLVCFGRWVSTRPIYYVDDRGLRDQLAHALPNEPFWTPPCDVRDLSMLIKALNLIVLTPTISVSGNLQQPQDLGEGLRSRFQRGVDYLSNELARNDPSMREELGITWDEFRNIPLFIYEEPFSVNVRDSQLRAGRVQIRMEALLSDKPRALYLMRGAIAQRDNGGRAVAALFLPDVRRRIEAEWVAAWISSEQGPVERMRFASDEEHAAALARLARKMESSSPEKIKVSTPISRTPSAKPRLLKSFQGGITSVAVHAGVPPKPATDMRTKPLAVNQPPPSPGMVDSATLTPPGYTNAEIEQRGWEILIHVLNATDNPELADFRRRHGVGADGAIGWKTFVEMKATGRVPQSTVEMSNSEYARARERDLDFILALVSGLEEGERGEVCLILDPAHRATVRPIQGVRLVNLSDALAVVIYFDNDELSEK